MDKSVGKKQPSGAIRKIAGREKRHLYFVVAVAAMLLAAGDTILALWRFSLDNDFASHILVIPPISILLLLRDRGRIFEGARNGPWLPAALGGVGIIGAKLAEGTLAGQDSLALRVFSLIVTVVGVFILIYGIPSFRAAAFPLLFLLLAVPIPQTVLAWTVRALQYGSAEFTEVLFRLTGTVFYREGTTFKLTGVDIDIGVECSGIRSSIALIIAMLLAGYFGLRSGWGRTALVLASVPVAMIKNAVRIAALSLLAVHSDVRWLTDSRLHRDGGIVFFGLALVLMLPVFRALVVIERRRMAVQAETRA